MNDKAQGVLAVIESCRDRHGMLNEDGRLLEWMMRKERQARAWGMTESADDCKAAAESHAFNTKAAADSLRKAGLVPLTMLRTTRRRARAGGAL